LFLRGKFFGVSDAFAALGLPRRPSIEPAAVQESFRSLAARLHPDRCGGDPAPLARINAARKTLLSNAARLRHLLDLTFPPASPPAPPPPDFQLFSQIGALGRSIDAFADQRERSTSALSAALLRQEAARLEAVLSDASTKLGTLRAGIEADIRRLDALWPDVPPAELSSLAGRATFIERWEETLRQSEIRLAGG